MLALNLFNFWKYLEMATMNVLNHLNALKTAAMRVVNFQKTIKGRFQCFAFPQQLTDAMAFLTYRDIPKAI